MSSLHQDRLLVEGSEPATGSASTLTTARGTSRRPAEKKAISTVPTQRQGRAQRSGTAQTVTDGQARVRRPAGSAGTLASRAKAATNATAKVATARAATAKAATAKAATAAKAAAAAKVAARTAGTGTATPAAEPAPATSTDSAKTPAAPKAAAAKATPTAKSVAVKATPTAKSAAVKATPTAKPAAAKTTGPAKSAPSTKTPAAAKPAAKATPGAKTSAATKPAAAKPAPAAKPAAKPAAATASSSVEPAPTAGKTSAAAGTAAAEASPVRPTPYKRSTPVADVVTGAEPAEAPAEVVVEAPAVVADVAAEGRRSWFLRRRPPSIGRRPALYLAAALIGATTVSTITTVEPAANATETVSHSVSVAQELGIEATAAEAISDTDATELLGELAVSRNARDAEQAAAAQVQAEADRVAAEAAAAAAAEAARPKAVLPVNGARLTSGFGARWGTLHAGIDLAAPMHTPEYAAMDGVVLEAGPASGYGLAVYIQHENGDVTVYGHMDSILVEPGQVVRAGDTIALLGNRGQSTGPHLHFEVHVGGLNGEKIDPLPWLRDKGVAI
jgi:murein DD-endopeptidase MepM/ murein hydrolase activator NlpD